MILLIRPLYCRKQSLSKSLVKIGQKLDNYQLCMLLSNCYVMINISKETKVEYQQIAQHLKIFF